MTVDVVDGKTYIQETCKLTEKLLDQHLPSEEVEPRSLHAAMRYSVMAGGKRLRPILALAAYEYCGGDVDNAPKKIHCAMAALEMVHTYSLIHDDLPCMDDDDLRRGRATCHKKFGEAIAVLAGDALHVVAFRLMAETGNSQTVIELAESLGTAGMIGGQMADMDAEGKEPSKEEVTNIHRRKTGALIRGAVRIGAILAGADRDILARLTRYGENIGLAFQIGDDLLDIEGDQDIIGKSVGSDDKNSKATYPRAVGLKTARDDANRFIDAAIGQFDEYDPNMLKYLALFIGQREN